MSAGEGKGSFIDGDNEVNNFTLKYTMNADNSVTGSLRWDDEPNAAHDIKGNWGKDLSFSFKVVWTEVGTEEDEDELESTDYNLTFTGKVDPNTKTVSGKVGNDEGYETLVGDWTMKIL